ncbi:type I-B CRISPR-associated protein Cas7/Cst2/DevR [Tepidibacter thalassicus]|uniref:CRISPR-associated protein Cas7/Cst2/DevR, subtype I-B/TNEAP n=1 Tax=Tepidibacter thalassicus DSM 15285 TaxID=1123350 RepID=A0A1M5PUE7_9FIRM|nr:type I-B CRISPR-associated protein Cas7/Cst2/DevR [Tepidibacter thalassicus]SHH05485.1 CRISPR-associated protein Cas7/Cst2/DevR, subtype I-B/TNEAP [Tepidibacter thalassicus DSM 15285]
MNKTVISCITLTILTNSPVALSNDQGFGNYTPIKKCFMGDGQYAVTSVGTITYEMRRALHKKGWNLSGIVLNADKKNKVKNMYPKEEYIEMVDENGLENDIFGFLIPDKQLNKTSPLRIIPFKSVHTFKNDTQLITNKGFLDKDLERKYFGKDGKKYEKELPQTQALANEEIFGDYYVYTITIELDRLGVLEVKDGKYLAPNERIYMDKNIRKKALKDILDVICNFTRTIKHQTVLLKPLAVFGGAFESVIPYFWNDVDMDRDNNLILDNVVETINSYDLKKENTIAVYSNRVKTKFVEIVSKEDKELISKGYPVKEINNLLKKIDIDENNKWYLTEKEDKNE